MFGRSIVANMKLEALVATVVMGGWMTCAAPFGVLAVSGFNWRVKPTTREDIHTIVALKLDCQIMLLKLSRKKSAWDLSQGSRKVVFAYQYLN